MKLKNFNEFIIEEKDEKLVKDMIDINKIYNQDCMKGMKLIPNESIDLIATDVPYRITARGSSGNSGGMLTTKQSMAGKIFQHNDITIEQYLPEFYRVLKDGTHCYIMCNHTNLTHFLKVIDDSKFHFTKSLIWMKSNKIMGSYYMSQFEYILLLRKGKNRKVNDCGISDILQFPNVKDKDKDGNNIHDSQKPIELFQTLVSQSTNEGELVLDPFMGSGTTALACIREKRNFIGFELSEKYYNIACKRIDEEINNNNVHSLF